MSHTPFICVIPSIHKRLANKKKGNLNFLSPKKPFRTSPLTNVTLQLHSRIAIVEEASMKNKHCKASLYILNADQIKLKGRSEEKKKIKLRVDEG